MLLGALRRFAAVVGVCAGGAAALGLAIALAAREDVRRGLAVGFYALGALLLGLGVLLSVRPPVRSKGDGGFVGLGRWMGGSVRWATASEHREAMNLPALLISVGVILIVLGVVLDDRHSSNH